MIVGLAGGRYQFTPRHSRGWRSLAPSKLSDGKVVHFSVCFFVAIFTAGLDFKFVAGSKTQESEGITPSASSLR